MCLIPLFNRLSEIFTTCLFGIYVKVMIPPFFWKLPINSFGDLTKMASGSTWQLQVSFMAREAHPAQADGARRGTVPWLQMNPKRQPNVSDSVFLTLIFLSTNFVFWFWLIHNLEVTLPCWQHCLGTWVHALTIWWSREWTRGLQRSTLWPVRENGDSCVLGFSCL